MAYKSDIFSIFVHLPIMIFELIVAIVVVIIGVVILLRWIDRRTRPTLYLSLSLFAISSAVFIAFFGLFSWFITWISSGMGSVLSPDFYSLSLPLGFSMVVAYNVFLFLFTIHIFSDKNEKKVIPFIIVGILLIVFLFLPNNYYGINNIPGVDVPSVRAISNGLFLAYNTVICVILAYYAFKEARQTENKVTQRGFEAIGTGQILNIVIFLMFLFDAIIIFLYPESPGYSIFIYIAWSSALIASFLFYLGYILPDWFKKLIEK